MTASLMRGPSGSSMKLTVIGMPKKIVRTPTADHWMPLDTKALMNATPTVRAASGHPPRNVA